MYAIDNRESYEEVLRLREQIMECKRQCTGVKTFKLLNVPTVVVGNKLDREKDRVLDRDEVTSLFEACPSTAYVETSAKKNINIDEVSGRSAALPGQKVAPCLTSFILEVVLRLFFSPFYFFEGFPLCFPNVTRSVGLRCFVPSVFSEYTLDGNQEYSH